MPAPEPPAGGQPSAEQIEQVRAVCHMLEDAISKRRPPDEVADYLLGFFPPFLIQDIVKRTSNDIVNELTAVVPEARLLVSQAGRNYMYQVHQMLVTKVNMAASRVAAS